MAPGFPKIKDDDKRGIGSDRRLKHAQWRRLSKHKYQSLQAPHSRALFSTANLLFGRVSEPTAPYNLPDIDASPFRQFD